MANQKGLWARDMNGVLINLDYARKIEMVVPEDGEVGRITVTHDDVDDEDEYLVSDLFQADEGEGQAELERRYQDLVSELVTSKLDFFIEETDSPTQTQGFTSFIGYSGNSR